MQLMNSNYSLKVKNYSKRTPATLKMIADIMLLLIPVVETVSLTCPDFPGKQWVFWGIITVFSVFKVISKFVADHSVSSD